MAHARRWTVAPIPCRRQGTRGILPSSPSDVKGEEVPQGRSFEALQRQGMVASQRGVGPFCQGPNQGPRLRPARPGLNRWQGPGARGSTLVYTLRWAPVFCDMVWSCAMARGLWLSQLLEGHPLLSLLCITAGTSPFLNLSAWKRALPWLCAGWGVGLVMGHVTADHQRGGALTLRLRWWSG